MVPVISAISMLMFVHVLICVISLVSIGLLMLSKVGGALLLIGRGLVEGGDLIMQLSLWRHGGHLYWRD